MTERDFNLVVPLAHKATDMRTMETTGSAPERSSAVSSLKTRRGDVVCTTGPAGPGIRTSTTATRTTTTRATGFAPAPSADWSAPADYTFTKLVEAYFDCRRTKRNSPSALAFEANLERNLRRLHDQLMAGTYKPGRSICFVITHPKPREVWAASFTDRIVHHLVHRHIAPRFYARFIADSCACIPGRGTLYAAKRLESKIRSITQNWAQPAHYLKCDLANFFVAIDKHVLAQLLARHVTEPWWWALTQTVLFHDPRTDFELRGDAATLALVPAHKRLTNHPAHLGLPIGNLSSQFFANVYLNELDQFVKHGLRARHYIRYVDDFVILHEDGSWLNSARQQIDTFLASHLAAKLNPRKTIIQPISRGVDLVGQVVKPWRRMIRRKTVHVAMERLADAPDDKAFQAANSYYGLMRQAAHSHADRARLSNLLLDMGFTVKGDLTKTYRRKGSA